MDIRLLGNVEIHGDADVVRPRRSGERCVLAVLALHARTPVTATALADRLWPSDEQTDKSHETIGSYLRRIRAAIKQAGGRPDWLRYDRAAHTAVLDIDPGWVDYHRFTSLASLARQHDDSIALQEALALWRGPALADISGQWADHRRHTLHAERLAAYDQLLSGYLAAGRHAEVARITAELADEVTPTDGLLLLGAQALAESGRHTAIPAWVRHVTARMRQSADTTPTPGVLDEIDQITARPTHRRPTPDPGTATAMFSMRADIPTFTGRDTELHTLLDAVRTALPDPHGDETRGGTGDTDGDQDGGGVRAVAIHTVDGMPGVGKTAFSVHAAHRLAHRFPDGNILLELHGHTPGQSPLTPGAALESLLRATGVDPKMIPPTLPDRARLWRDRMAGRKVLLVLDDAADHEQVRPLLPGTAGNLVLITSRHRLAALEGVTPLPLNVLPPDQAGTLLARLAGRPRDPGHAGQTGDEAAGLARIAAYCGHLPLAITLAGAQLRNHPSWSATYLADLLAVEHDRLEHLDIGDRSVRAAFDMSFHHLTTDQQHLFRLLGVHPGPQIDTFATAALTDSPLREARRGLADLHAGHLIEETTPSRYHLHDLLRVYAHALAADLDPVERRDALDRVLNYYQHTIQTANTHLPTPHTPPLPPATTPPHTPRLDDLTAAQEWLTVELPTLTACLKQAATEGHEHQASHLATALHPFLRLSGHTDLALAIHQTALSASLDSDDRAGQAIARTNLGDIHYLRGEYTTATDNLNLALGLFAAPGDLDTHATTDSQWGQANALAALGRVQDQQGEYTAAADNLTHALDLYTALGDRSGQASALTTLGSVRGLRGEYTMATDNLTHALDLYATLGDRWGQATVLNNLGRLQHRRGDYTAANDSHTRALNLYTTIGFRLGQANALTALGRVQDQRGDYTAANDSHTRALDLYTALGSRLGQATALTNLGIVQQRRGDYTTATDSHTRALDIYVRVGSRLGQANARTNLGVVQGRRGDHAAALDSHAGAVELYATLGDRWGQACALTNLGIVQHQLGDYAAALDSHTRALDIYATIGDPDGEAETLNNLGDLALDHPGAGDPHAHFNRALTIAKDIGTTSHQAHALAGLALCLLPTTDSTQAIALLQQAHSLYHALGVPEATEIQTILSTLDKPRRQQAVPMLLRGTE